MQATCLKPSEYRGDQNTAVAGRIVILKQQEVKVKKPAHSAAAPAAGKKRKRRQRRQSRHGSRFGTEAGGASSGHGKLVGSALCRSLGRDRRPARAEVRRGRRGGHSRRLVHCDARAVLHVEAPLPLAPEGNSRIASICAEAGAGSLARSSHSASPGASAGPQPW